MVDTIESITRRTVRSELSFRVKDKIAEGTATAGAAGTLTDASNLSFQNTDYLKGAWVFIHTGTGMGQERYISAQTTAGVISVSPNWAVNPDSTSQYEVHRKYRIADYNNSITAAIRADRDYHVGGRLDVSLVSRNAIKNALFTHWANGASSAPDNWTLSGSGSGHSIARNTDLNRRGPYAAVITTELNETTSFSQVVNNVYKGQSGVLSALVYCGVASRVTLKVDDGVTTATSSANHGGTGWEILTVTHSIAPTISVPATTVSVEVSTGASIDVGLAWVYMKRDEQFYNYEVPAEIDYIHLIEIEKSAPSTSNADWLPRFRELKYGVQNDWYIGSGMNNPSPSIYIRKHISGNKVLKIHGSGRPAVPTADTDVLELNVELVINSAGSVLAGDDRMHVIAEGLKNSTNTALPANSIPVRRV